MEIEEKNDGEIFDEQSRELLASLEECHETCQEGLMHSLEEGGDFAEKDHIRWLLDCSAICKMAVDFYIRDSEYAGDILSLCAYVCEDCAESCDKFFNDAHMVACSQVCKNCAAKCRDMIVEEEEIEEDEEIETEPES